MTSPVGHNGVAGEQLRSIVARIEKLLEERDAIMGDVKDVYAEAKANGYNKTALGIVIAARRKRAKDASKADELSALVELYENALGTAPATHTHEASR